MTIDIYEVARCILILCSNYTIILPKSCNLSASVELEPPNIKEDLANDMVLTGLQNCQSTDGLLEQNGEKKLRI